MPEPSSPSRPPAMSVVVVTPGRFDQLRRTVRCLRAQTLAHRLEVVVVAADAEAVADRRPGELDGFADARVVAVGPIDNVDTASAAGVHAARAPVVAIVEDHGYPRPGWAEAVLAAYRVAGADAVGAVMGNANPRRSLSWANLLLAYGQWTDPRAAGAVDDVPGHNITYRTTAVSACGDELAAHLGRDGDLHDRLRAKGARMVLAPGSRLDHVNPSIVASTAALRVDAGRLYGARRAEAGGWSPAKRWAYAAAWPAIALVRLRRLWPGWFGRGGAHRDLVPRVVPALALALAFDAAGQALGYTRGVGGAARRLATFEMDRRDHVTAADRREMAA